MAIENTWRFIPIAGGMGAELHAATPRSGCMLLTTPCLVLAPCKLLLMQSCLAPPSCFLS